MTKVTPVARMTSGGLSSERVRRSSSRPQVPGMTMSFPVMQSGALDKLKVGDKVKFVAEDRSGNTVITRIEPVR